MVCAHCGSESHRTNSSNCPNFCTLCKEPGHRQKRAECEFRVCNKCGASGHSTTECPQMATAICDECGETGHSANKCPIHPCNACGLRTHKLPTSHLCPERVLHRGFSPSTLSSNRWHSSNNLQLGPSAKYPKDAPPHALKLGLGDIDFLVRNLNKKLRLTNNTRVEVIAVSTRYITVQTLGSNRLSTSFRASTSLSK